MGKPRQVTFADEGVELDSVRVISPPPRPNPESSITAPQIDQLTTAMQQLTKLLELQAAKLADTKRYRDPCGSSNSPRRPAPLALDGQRHLAPHVLVPLPTTSTSEESRDIFPDSAPLYTQGGKPHFFGKIDMGCCKRSLYINDIFTYPGTICRWTTLQAGY